MGLPGLNRSIVSYLKVARSNPVLATRKPSKTRLQGLSFPNFAVNRPVNIVNTAARAADSEQIHPDQCHHYILAE